MPERPSARRELRRAVTRAVQRLEPVAGPRLRAGLATARSAVGRGPLLLAPVADRSLVLAPHPDDETIGCGGTVLSLRAAGGDVSVLYATSGSAGVSSAGSATAVAQRRCEEAIDACALLGSHPPRFLGLPDGALADHVGRLTAELRSEIDAVGPDIIFAPWPGDGHPDHRAVAIALVAAGPHTRAELWFYEVWSPLPANRIVDVTAVWDTKTAALACHRSAGDLSAHLGLGRWRSLFGLDGVGWAEAFAVVRPGEDDDLRALGA